MTADKQFNALTYLSVIAELTGKLGQQILIPTGVSEYQATITQMARDKLKDWQACNTALAALTPEEKTARSQRLQSEELRQRQQLWRDVDLLLDEINYIDEYAILAVKHWCLEGMLPIWNAGSKAIRGFRILPALAAPASEA